MKLKTKSLAERFTALFSRWPEVECVTLNEAAMSDTLDPYFALVLDVFFKGSIQEPEQRVLLYGNDISAFENSGEGMKDRFLAGALPVRIEYKNTAWIEELVSGARSGTPAQSGPAAPFRESGTYGFYRLSRGEVLFSRSAWIDAVREDLAAISPGFWTRLRASNQSKMEHFLNDLGAAVFQGDDFFSLVSSAGFIKQACLTLFCINRRFEPSHRAYAVQVLELPVLPAGFAAGLEVFLSEKEGGASAEKRYTLAKLLAKDIIALP